MEWYHGEDMSGMFLIEGEGFFVGDEDILLGQQFVETILNEGFHVIKSYGHTDAGENALFVKFTTQPNAVLITERMCS